MENDFPHMVEYLVSFRRTNIVRRSNYTWNTGRREVKTSEILGFVLVCSLPSHPSAYLHICMWHSAFTTALACAVVNAFDVR